MAGFKVHFSFVAGEPIKVQNIRLCRRDLSVNVLLRGIEKSQLK